MRYGYGGCTTRQEESRGSIGDDIEVEYYGGDGKDLYKEGISIFMVLLIRNYRGIIYLGQTPSTPIWTDQPKHIPHGELLYIMSPCTVAFHLNCWHH
jgi:hypothetical protein